MSITFDVLTAGAGYAGAVAARALAEQGKRVLVLERRPHIGGNAYDRLDDAGVLIHQYGPHIFHPNNKEVFDWLSRFTQWRDYQHRVVANIPDEKGGRMTYPVPFNLTSLETAFGPEEGRRLGDKLIAAYGAEKKVTILQLRENTEILKELGAKEVHMRIACPPLIWGCPFINFSASKSELELIARRVIMDFETGNKEATMLADAHTTESIKIPEERLQQYAKTDSPEYKAMVAEIAKRLNIDTLKFSKLETIIEAIGLPKCKVCTHCFDGSSAHTI